MQQYFQTANSFSRSSGLSKKIILGFVVVALLAFTLGYQVAVEGYRVIVEDGSIQWYVSAADPESEQGRLDLRRFWRVLSLIEENYLRLDELDRVKLVDGAIGGMVEALGDPYTYYLSSDETSSFQESLDGTYEGIGVQLGFKEDQLVIIAPLEGGPAEKAGIQAGDIIVAVDGESVANLNLGEVVQKVRGEKGTSVVLSLGRKNASNTIDVNEITVERAEINAPNMLLTWEEEGIAYIQILRFGTGIEKEWQSLVQDLRSQQVKGIVLDVRDNPGGYLNGAVEIASSFTSDRHVIVSERFTNGELKNFTATHEGQLQDIPVVVVMNESSASSSEILAGALRQLAGATLVGVKSFGKNTVQEAYNLDGGSSVHITAANWVLPNGEVIPDEGLAPDIEVVNEEGKDDLQKPKALETLQQKLAQ
jgi:carboxyl-terminal processing protease